MEKREIKFRAWDKEGEEMFRVVGVYFPHENSKSEDIIVNGRGGTANIKPEHLMQYTGLKDKNGVEIYEGDVIENNDKKWEVYWDENCYWGIRMIVSENITTGRNMICGEDIHSEIIGNIYENPELLSPSTN